MTCMKAQGLITPFINNKLNIEELEEFIDHIDTCSNCREELEVYYALLTAMKQLDEDKNLSSNFVLELNDKLEKSQEKILHAKYTYYRKITVLIFTMILLAFFISISYAKRSSEDSGMNDIEEMPTQVVDEQGITMKSDFHLRYEFWIPSKQIREMQLLDYLKEYQKKNFPSLE